MIKVDESDPVGGKLLIIIFLSNIVPILKYNFNIIIAIILAYLLKMNKSNTGGENSSFVPRR